MNTKICTYCGEEKDISLFGNSNKVKSGKRANCKECQSKYMKKYVLDNKEKIYRNNIDSYYANNDSRKEYQKEYERIKRLTDSGKEIIRCCHNKYMAKRIKNDNLFKIKHTIKSNISRCIKTGGFAKRTRTELILGCSFIEFKVYIESKFENWMTWENQGKYNGELNYGWDLDHIVPIASAKTEEDIYKLNHYTNFQPLCSFTNRYIKKDNII